MKYIKIQQYLHWNLCDRSLCKNVCIQSDNHFCDNEQMYILDVINTHI